MTSHRYPDFHLIMPLFVCRSWVYAPAPREGQKVAWVAHQSLHDYPMPAADVPLVARLTALLGAG